MVIIVGSGPSLHNMKRGKEIDEFETVVRLVNVPNIDGMDAVKPVPADHGTKVTYFSVGINDVGRLDKHHVIPDKGTWVYSRPGHMTDQHRKGIEDKYSAFKLTWRPESDKWVTWFTKFARNLREWNAPFPDNGTMTTILTAEILKPEAIYLAGFDAFWDYTRTERGGHDLIASRMLLTEMGLKLRKF